MGNQREEKQVFNVNLAKKIGLYQILDPGIVKYSGYNVLHVAVIYFIMFLAFMTTVVNVNGAYYWNNVHTNSLIYLVGSTTSYYVCYKMYVVIKNSGHIWDCLSVARFDFTKHKHRDGGLLDIWRKRSVRVTYAYFYISIIALLSFLLYPVMFNDTTVKLENRNGSLSNYRINILNLHLLALFDDTKYNRHFGVFYFIEGMIAVIFLIMNFIVDMVLITLSLALMCQLQMVCIAFESLGHKKTSDRRTSGIHVYLARCIYFS